MSFPVAESMQNLLTEARETLRMRGFSGALDLVRKCLRTQMGDWWETTRTVSSFKGLILDCRKESMRFSIFM